MNRYVLLLLCFIGGLKLSAQTVLDSACYPASLIGTDSLKKTTYNSTFPALAKAVDGMWDLSIVNDSLPVFFRFKVPDNSCDFSDSVSTSVGIYNYVNNVQINIRSTGILDIGKKIRRSPFSLFAITAHSVDSLIIIEQTSANIPAPQTAIAFSTLYGNSWNWAGSFDVRFWLTVVAYGDTLAPGIIRTYTSETDTVVGWGKMRVKDAVGNPSDYLSVLQVQTRTIATDSFFLKGAPFPGALLTTLGLIQGKCDTTYEQLYYRRGEVTPLARVTFRDAAYTQPYKATTHVQRLSAVGISELAGEAGISIYPNPTTTREFTVSLPGSDEWSYTVYSLVGLSVVQGRLQGNSITPHRILLPPDAAPGLYYVRISNTKGTVVTKALTLRAN